MTEDNLTSLISYLIYWIFNYVIKKQEIKIKFHQIRWKNVPCPISVIVATQEIYIY